MEAKGAAAPQWAFSMHPARGFESRAPRRQALYPRTRLWRSPRQRQAFLPCARPCRRGFPAGHTPALAAPALVRLAPPISPLAKPGWPVTRCACAASRPKFAALVSGPALAAPALVRLAPPISPLAKPGWPVTRCACAASRPKFAALVSGPTLAAPALVRLAPPISPLAKPGWPVTRCACAASRPKFAALVSGPALAAPARAFQKKGRGPRRKPL